ncbi:MAG TPA: ATP-dependent protease subunit HslV [bacterium]|nr:ATP-dependent protease subunit HslV [bacterium]
MIKGTTILMVRHQGKIVLAGDGQVTLENIVLKHAAKKVRRLYQDKVMSGFAGATADAFTLYERFEGKLEKHTGNLRRAAVGLAKDWRTDRALRQLQALMIVADENESYLISGTGDVIEPEDGVLAIGSGGPFASAAARALIRHTRLSAREVAEEAMKIAADMCIYTNDNFVFDEMDSKT